VQRRLPVVLSQAELAAMFRGLDGEHLLFAQLLYGTGLRLTACLQLRVKDVGFRHGAIIVRAGKGGKDRVLVLPTYLVPALRDQLARSHRSWAMDQAKGQGGVELPRALDRQHPLAGGRGWGSGAFRNPSCPPTFEALWSGVATCSTRPSSAQQRLQAGVAQSSLGRVWMPARREPQA
jgi:hypothetical protein